LNTDVKALERLPSSGLELFVLRIAVNLVNLHTIYQEFLTLWKDIDPDTPILKQAKAEYVGLK
jgi:hypothetical protein